MKFGDSAYFWASECSSAEDLTDWFRSPKQRLRYQDRALRLADKAVQIFPDLRSPDFSYVIDCCAVATTPGERPIIDQLGNNFFFAGGFQTFPSPSTALWRVCLLRRKWLRGKVVG